MKTSFFAVLVVAAAIACAQDAGPDYVPVHERFRMAELVNNMEARAPILSEHPTNVPPGGFFYRITGTNGVTKLYFAREDMLSTQLSAHNDSGEEVACTVDLRTGTERSINLRALCRAKKFSDFANAETVKTNRPNAR